MTHIYNNILQWSIRGMLSVFVIMSIGLFTSTDAQAQDPVWTVNAPESDWFGTGNTERGMTYNPATGHIIVASRQGGVKPAVIDAATGTYLKDLDNTGIAGGTFAFNQIRATEDGQIFTANLTTASAGSAIKIYRWADEDSAPTMIYDATYAADIRFGDSFGAYGTGSDITLLLSGSNPGVILKFAWDGTTLTLADEWTVDQNDGRGGFSHHMMEVSEDGDMGVMITGSGISPSVISLTDGSDVIPALSSDEVASGTFNSVMYADFADFGMQTLIVTGPASSDKKFYVFVPSALAPDVLVKVGEMGPFDANANGNNTGGVVIDDENAMIYIMNTNNVLSAYDVYDFIDYPTPANLIFSEYIEGSSNNKALEITNLGDTEVDLSYYQIMQSSNGNGWQYYHEFAEGAVVDAGDQYVLITDQVFADLFPAEAADEVLGFPSPIHFNGDDARALIFIGRTDTTILDVIGDPDNDPGSAWDVAGESGVTREATLLRKPTVTTGNTTVLGSFGTTPGTSEWYVLEQNDFSNLGMPTPVEPANLPAMAELSDGQVFSVFSDDFTTDATVDTWRTSWSVADYEEVVLDGNTVKKYSNLDFVGVETVANQIDISGMTHVRFDVWTPNATLLRIKLVDFGADGAFAGGDDVEHEIAVENPVQGEWVTYDIPLTEFTGLTTNKNIAQHIFSAQPTGGATVYLDNYMFYNANAIDPVIVTFRVNTSTMPDTLRENHFMQIRGGFSGPDVADAASAGMITWDSMSRHMYNEGGDYWWADFPMSPGDTLNYKFWAGVSPDVALTNGNEAGWESGGNNVFVLPADFSGADTTAALQFYETREAPYPTHEDSISLFFRVNMGPAIKAGNFDPQFDSVGVRGSFDGWTDGIILEAGANQGDNFFFEGTKQLSLAEAGPITDVNYKFITISNGEIGWESDPNRSFTMPAADSTIHWDYFNRLGFPPSNANTDPVKVTFTVNMATLLDTLQEYHTVQIKGAPVGADGANTGLGSIITWDTGSLEMTNIGGDYWQASFDMSPGDVLNYKFWAGVDPETPLINGTEQGWESGDNNVFALPANAAGDTVLPVQWYETRMKPFESKTDSVGIWFRVNVGAEVQLENFDPEVHTMAVRGTPAPLAWDDSAPTLNYEGANGNNHFYAGVIYFDADDLAASAPDNRPAQTVKYKFFMNNGTGDGGYEAGADKFVTLGSLADTTFQWDYFSGKRPSDSPVLNTTLNFEVNVGILEGLGYFNSSIDTVYARGTFNGWGQNQMAFNSFSGTFEASNIPFKTTVGADVAYKYYVKWDKSRDDESSVNYLAGIIHDQSGWEEPGVTGGGDRLFSIVDGENQPKRSEFFNGVEPKALMTSANVDGGSITVNFAIDMTPATDNAAQPFDASNDSVYLFVDTPFFALTNGITVPGDGGGNWLTISDEERESLRFTDEDGDMIYTLALELQLPTLNHIGFRVAYGEPTSEDGSLFVHGSGFSAGRRHYQYVQPIVAENGAVTWPSSYTMPTLTWKIDDLDWEAAPDYNTPTTSAENETEVVREFALNQNYPNPFNPTTNISFSLADAAPVKLTVYNLLGQEVATLISGKVMNAGTHNVAFNAASLSSGVYIYRLEAGSFVSNKRMTLIK